jgi:uncharacterized protein (TIGR02722 family)
MRNMKMILLTGIIAVMLAGCSSNPQVKRVDSAKLTDLTQFWNDNDVAIVCKDLIADFLASPRIADFSVKNKRLPVIRVGNFKNASSEPIDTTIISKRMQVEILASGKAEFVADRNLSEELREEAQDQLSWVSADSAVRIGEEAGADFLLTGSVKSIIQSVGNEQVRFYTVTAEATDIQSHFLAWSAENDSIKKVVKKAALKF